MTIDWQLVVLITLVLAGAIVIELWSTPKAAGKLWKKGGSDGDAIDTGEAGSCACESCCGEKGCGKEGEEGREA